MGNSDGARSEASCYYREWVVKLTVRNWERFQHYQSRRPPWIKLHRSLLDDRGFSELSDYASKLLVQCWLVASESVDGTIDGSVEDIAFRVHRSREDVATALKELAKGGFLAVDEGGASVSLASRYQPAPKSCSETETETETKKKRVRSYPIPFEEVWLLHRRGTKASAYDEYRLAVPALITHEGLLSALKTYAESLSNGFRGVHLQRFIKDQRWEEFEGDATPGALKRDIVLGPIEVMP